MVAMALWVRIDESAGGPETPIYGVPTMPEADFFVEVYLQCLHEPHYLPWYVGFEAFPCCKPEIGTLV
jgi:hypothetical protein